MTKKKKKTETLPTSQRLCSPVYMAPGIWLPIGGSSHSISGWLSFGLCNVSTVQLFSACHMKDRRMEAISEIGWLTLLRLKAQLWPDNVCLNASRVFVSWLQSWNQPQFAKHAHLILCLDFAIDVCRLPSACKVDNVFECGTLNVNVWSGRC